MPRHTPRFSRPKLQLEHLEGRDVPAVITIPVSADGLVADRDLNGTYDEVITNDTSISNRWFASTGQERGVFEFSLAGVAPGSTINSAAFEYEVSSFTSGSAGFPQLVLRAYAGDGGISLADGNATSTLAGTGTVTALGVGQVSLNPSAIQSLLGGNATIRVQNSELSGQWASFYAIEFSPANRRARLVLDVTAPPTPPTTLSVSATPNSFGEAAGANAATGTVTRTGDLSQPLTVSLSSNDTTEATVPVSVTIPANQSTASFPIAAVDDPILDGSQTVTITASAQIPGGGSTPLQLDPTFGTGGLAQTALRSNTQFPHAAIAYLPDGKVLAASELDDTHFQLTRLNANGTVDTSFGTNGVVTTAASTGTSRIPTPFVIAVQPDGKYLVGGRFSGGPAAPFLARYNTDGTLDGSFGIIATSNLNEMVPNTYVTDIAVRPDGRILLGLGESGTVFSRVAQLTAGGSRDLSFGGTSPGNGTGVAFLSSAYGLSAEQVELLSDGSFLVAGSFQSTARVARVVANGTSLVSSFGNGITAPGGVANINFATSSVGFVQLERDSQGRIIYGSYITNNGSTDFAVARLTPNGTLDTTFAGDGTTVLSFPNAEDIVTGMVIQADDKIVLGGVSISVPGGVYDSALARFNTNGTPDATFDGDGFYRQSLVTTFTPDLIYDIALQPDGDLLALTGWATDMRVARFNLDSQPTTVTATTTVTVLDNEVANRPPVAQGFQYGTPEDTPLNELLRASDPDGNPLTYTLLSQPAQGTAQITNASTGAFTYTPPLNFNGTVSFTFKVNDGQVDSTPATVFVTVNPVNDAPVAQAQARTTAEDTAVSGTLVATDVDSTALAYSIVTQPTHGTITAFNAATGAYTYTPNANFNGTDSFTFRTSDGSLDSNTAAVSLTVTPVNDGPVAVNDSATVAEDAPATAINVRANDSDVDGDALSVTAVTQPANGTVVITGGGTGLTYQPAANFNGTATFTYTVSDGNGGTATATVTATVAPVNDAPVAQGQSAATNEDAALNGQLVATDIDGPALTYSRVSGPANGTLIVNPNGTFTYTPNANYNGSDSFTFKANDGTADSNIATVTITVRPVNDAPVAAGFQFGTDEDTALNELLRASDVDGDALAFSLVSQPAQGTVQITNASAGAFTFTPAPNFNGTVSFDFKVNDGTADSAPARVFVTVRPVNDAPVAQGQSVATNEDTAFGGQVAATDVDGNPLTYSLVSGPANGTLTLNSNGTFTYTPTADFNGTDSFTFRASDGALDSNVATVSITVRAVNDAPTLPGATFSLPENSPNGTAVGTVTGSDVEGDSLTYSITAGNTGGAFAINPTTGAITVANAAALNFESTPVFTLTVQVRDSGGLVGTATVRINLTDVPEPFAVAIDIRPGDARNRVNPRSGGKIEVAILSTADFDARQVDVASLRFGRTGTENSLSLHPNKGPRYQYEDVNGDGRLDLVVQFEAELTGFLAGDTKGILSGRLLNGMVFSAEDSVST